MHLLMASNSPAAHLDHNKWFNMYTDTSDSQVGKMYCSRRKAGCLVLT
jgi:hypothetical protein